jgi:hypothetical protein
MHPCFLHSTTKLNDYRLFSNTMLEFKLTAKSLYEK